MAKTFHVTAPDGHTLEVTGPDDATEEQAIRQAQGMYQPGAAKPEGEQPWTPGGVASVMAGQAGRALGTAASDLNPIPLVRALAHPVDTAKGMFNATSNAVGRTREALGKGQYGEAAKSAVGAIPVLGPQAEQMTRDVTEGRIPEAVGHAGALYLGGKLPKVIGNLANITSEGLGEASMGATARDKITGGNPGRAFRTESNAWTPEGVRADLAAKKGPLAQEVTNIARQTTTPASLQPALNVVKPRIAAARGAGATATAENLEPLRQYFEGEAPPGFRGRTIQPPAPMVPQTSPIVGPNGQPITTMVPGKLPPAEIAPTQSAEQLLNMRREFSPNFNVKYGPTTQRPTKIAQGMYGATTGELKRIAPDIVPLDQRLTDILASERPLATTQAKPGIIPRVMGRVGARTGALLGGAAGYQFGGLPGAIAGIVGPELVADPAAQAAVARALAYGGRGLASRPAALAGRVVPLTPRLEGE